MGKLAKPVLVMMLATGTGWAHGGRAGLRIGLGHLDEFAYLDSFSTAIYITDITKDTTASWTNSAVWRK